MKTKEEYVKFANDTELALFAQPWWLNAVCGEDNWNVVIFQEGGSTVAALPYYIERKYGFTYICQPPLTPRLGPWMLPLRGKYSKQLSKQKKILTSLIEQLPDFDYFCQNFNYSSTNWLPFYWKGFRQTTYYTYLLEDLSNTNLIWKNFQEKVRADIRKAEKKLIVNSDLDIDSFLKLHELTFKRKKLSLPYKRDLVRRLDRACLDKKRRRIFYAQDEEGQVYAAIYIVWNKSSAYYLMGGTNPELKYSGVHSLLIWEAIKFASTVTQKFDFEGSMLESVESFFRGFGATQVPYFHVSAMNHRTQILFASRELLKSIFRHT